MKALSEFNIQFVGLKTGEHSFEFQIKNKFFEHFEYAEFNDADLFVNVKLIKKSTILEFQIKAKGVVNLNCDLSNEPYDEYIENSYDLIVKFGSEYNNDNEEVLILPFNEYEINLAQYIYELIVLSVPTKRIHPGVKDGTLNSDILKRLEELSPKGIEKKNGKLDPRWDSLKKLLTDK